MRLLLPSNVTDLDVSNKVEIARCLTAIETGSADETVLNLLDDALAKPKGIVIGLTGPPGVGKSTLIGSLIDRFRAKKVSVAVIAVDPSSNLTGGAILGDRTRFKVQSDDTDIFIRSMANKNYTGGLAEISYPALVLMRAIFDIVLIETVGIGQSETQIVDYADLVIFCAQPASGDSLQFIKAGIMEIPDIIFVTKGDLGKVANQTAADIKGALSLAAKPYPVEVLVVSVLQKTGLEDGFKLIEKYLKKLDSQLTKDKRKTQHLSWVRSKVGSSYGIEILQNFNQSDTNILKDFSGANEYLNIVKNIMSEVMEKLNM